MAPLGSEAHLGMAFASTFALPFMGRAVEVRMCGGPGQTGADSQIKGSSASGAPWSLGAEPTEEGFFRMEWG